VVSVSWRDNAKRVIEGVLVKSGAANRAAERAGRRVAVLAFHNIVGDEDRPVGDRSLHMTAGHFANLIEVLAKRAMLLPLADALRPSPGARGLRIAITFDDAYHGAVTRGLSVLKSMRVPSTIFVAPGLLGSPLTWWDEIASRTTGSIPSGERDAYLDGPAAGRSAHIRAISSHINTHSDVPSLRIATIDVLSEAARHHDVTLGSHTWTHPNLAALANDPHARSELVDELRKPLEWLRAFEHQTVPMLAYPYGRWNDQAARAVEEAGYSAAFRVDGGAIVSIAPPAFAIPRINIPAAMNAAGVFVRMAGWRQ